MYDDVSSRDMQPNSPEITADPDYTSEDDEEADIVEGVRVKSGFPEYRRMFSVKAVHRQPMHNPPSTKKWVKETKGDRTTVDDYGNVIQMLRAL